MRSCRLTRSRMTVFVTRIISQFCCPGPHNRLYPAFPYVKSAGTEKAAGLKYCAMVRFPGYSGAPETTFGRPPTDPCTDVEKLGENGAPDIAVVSPATCHPLTSLPATPSTPESSIRPRPNGRSYT